jgi:hypothetical protein
VESLGSAHPVAEIDVDEAIRLDEFVRMVGSIERMRQIADA